MAVAKVIEVSAESAQSFEDAIRMGIHKATDSVHGVKGAWVKEQKVVVANRGFIDLRCLEWWAL